METGLAREVRQLEGAEPVTRTSPVHGHDVTRLDFEEGLAVEPPSDHSKRGIAEDHVVPPERQRPPLDRQLVPNHCLHRAPADPTLIHRLQRVGDLDMAGADRHREDMEVVVRSGALRDLPKHGLEQLLWRPLLKSIFQVAVEIYHADVVEKLVTDPIRFDHPAVERIGDRVRGGDKSEVGIRPGELLQDLREPAAVDYEYYLRLRPEALDRALVAARVNQLRARRLSASQAFGLGVVIPVSYTHLTLPTTPYV